MILSITYSELQNYILSHTQQEVSLTFVNPKTIKISKQIKILFMEQVFGIDFIVKSIDNHNLILTYEQGGATEMALKAGLKYLQDKPIASFLEMNNEDLMVKLDKIGKLESLLQKVKIMDLHFQEEYVEVEMELL